MNFIFSWNRALQAAALGAVVLLSGCQSSALPRQQDTGSHPNIAPAQMTMHAAGATPTPTYVGRVKKAGSFSPVAGKAYLYMADESNNQIDIYPVKGQNKPQVGTITAGIEAPYGLWFDRGAQELYVANQADTVTVYPYGSTQPSRTYTQDLNRPLYPIVDSHGELYVGNANDGTVVEYLKGTTNVHQVLQTPGVEADGLALDKHENLYVAYRDSSGRGSIEEFAPGSTNGKILGMTLDEPQGVVVVPRGTVVATETGATNRIDVFPTGSMTESFEVPMPSGSNVATELVIDCKDEFLYVSALYSGIVFGSNYPLRGQSLFVKDQAPATIQGATISNNQNF